MVFHTILTQNGFSEEKAFTCAKVFTSNSTDGIYSHGVNRFVSFIKLVREGCVHPGNEARMVQALGGLEQWEGSLAPGILNALQCTDRAMELAGRHGIGTVALAHTNHWMRGGYYGWHAASKGYVFIGWTNTIANMPAWGAIDARLGNNPLVIAVPYEGEAIVLDMAASQFSYGALEMSALKKETLPVFGGFDTHGSLTKDPAEIVQSKRVLPVGYWKGAGLSLLLDILGSVLSGGLSTRQISMQQTEYGVSQVFIAIHLQHLKNLHTIDACIHNIIEDYKASTPEPGKEILYPGERVVRSRAENLAGGIPVHASIWEQILLLQNSNAVT